MIPVKQADWRQVLEIASGLLATRTKDLRLAVWMTEALAHVRGLTGLAEGYALVNGLRDMCWEALAPRPEDGEHEQRIGCLEWLAAQTVRLARTIPLTHSAA